MLKCVVWDIFVQGVITEVPEIILRCISRDEAALAVAQKVCFLLLENFWSHTHTHLLCVMA
jgi:CCR4-NOT transcription complex subunit 1